MLWLFWPTFFSDSIRSWYLLTPLQQADFWLPDPCFSNQKSLHNSPFRVINMIVKYIHQPLQNPTPNVPKNPHATTCCSSQPWCRYSSWQTTSTLVIVYLYWSLPFALPMKQNPDTKGDYVAELCGNLDSWFEFQRCQPFQWRVGIEEQRLYIR